MEKLLLFVVTLCFTVLTLCSSEPENGYIFFCPRTWKMGAMNEMNLIFYGNHEPGALKVQVFYTESYEGNQSLAAEKEYSIEADAENIVLQLQIPPLDDSVYAGKIVIDGSVGDYTLNGNDSIDFRTSKENIALIQTDKPIYKEGQEVRFRLLCVDKNLRPKENVEADIWVEDPNGFRTSQWLKESIGNGIKQYEFFLSDEPTKGEWKITASVQGQEYYTMFEVKEYVLPKFDVEINIPPFVLSNAEEIPITVCAKYTYGKPVKGILSLNISLEKYTWSSEKLPQSEYLGEFNGCYDYKINVSLVEPGDYYRYRKIQIFAKVTEQGTGVERNATKLIQREYSPLNLQFNQQLKLYFKPGLPYNGELKVTNPDGTQAENEPIEICALISRERVLSQWWATKKIKFCSNYTSGENGIIKFTIPPQNADSTRINLEAKSLRFKKDPSNSGRQNSLNQPQTSSSLTPWYSPSGNFIQLQPVKEALQCNSKKNVKLLFTSKDNAEFKFYYVVISQGNVVTSGSVDTAFAIEDDVSENYNDDSKLINQRETQIVPPLSEQSSSNPNEDCPSAREARYIPPIGSVDIEIDVDPSLSPSFYLLVYYVRDDREVVADSQKFSVEKCFKNKVTFDFGDEAVQPGTKTTLNLKASPNSMCGIKVVDKSVSLLNSNDQLTTDKIFELIEAMDSGRYYGTNRCNENIPQPGLYSKASPSSMVKRKPWSSSSYEDSLAAFENIGRILISNMTLFTRPCKSENGGGDNIYYEYDRGGAQAGSPVALASVARRPAAASHSKSGISAMSATKSAVDVRNFFPETWLFELVAVGPEGDSIFKKVLPHTITEWVGSAVCINAEDGLGLSNKTSIKGFQAFFLSFTLPYSMIRGEIMTVVVSLFNYVDKALPIKVTLDPSEDYTVVGDLVDEDICLQPDGSDSIIFRVKAISLGTVNMTVRAETEEGACGSQPVADSYAKDAITNSFIVEPEGFPRETVESVLICPKEEENEKFSQKFSLDVPEDVVPDSPRAFFDITGNVLGPSLLNLENLVQLPTGCGEQNMVKFFPNLVVLDFLTATGKLTDKIQRRAIKNLNTGAQREMQYRHSDGSFSAFGYRDAEGSMFLSCFVLRAFSQARRYITIDNAMLQQIQEFIVSKQQNNGCFPDIGRIIDRGIQGGLENEKSEGTITAYALVSLLISGYENETVVDSALSCIKENSDNRSPYVNFLYSYAEAFAGKIGSSQERVNAEREKANVTAGVEYYPNINGSNSKNVETAAYAVLTILKTGGSSSDVLPIVRYLTQNMNPRGGFHSTQDTCVGLEALSEFSKLTFSDPIDLVISTSGAIEKEITVTEEDKMVVKRNKISEVPGEVNVEAEGSGCALLQTVLRYNTKTGPEENSFRLTVVGECVDDPCTKGNVNVSTSYLPKGESGMAVLEVNMVSGYVPMKESLDKLMSDKKIGVMRSDVEDNSVVLYFTKISNSPTVFAFQVEKVFNVEDKKPAVAKVYDYYAKEKSASTSYLLEECEKSSNCSEDM